jgi:hypothetical protein
VVYILALGLYGMTPLLWAAQHGHQDVIEFLRGGLWKGKRRRSPVVFPPLLYNSPYTPIQIRINTQQTHSYYHKRCFLGAEPLPPLASPRVLLATDAALAGPLILVALTDVSPTPGGGGTLVL